MSFLDDRHFYYIFASYSITALLLGGLIVWIYFSYQAKKKQLNRLEQQTGETKSNAAKENGVKNHVGR